MKDGTIEIVIKQGGSGGNGTGESSSKTLSGQIKKIKNKLFDATEQAAMSYAINTAMSLTKSNINYAINNYGNLTGNYIAQREINKALDVLGKAQGIINAGVSGALTGAGFGGGVYGAVAGAAIGVTTATIQTANQIAQSYISFATGISKSNYQNQFTREMMGQSLGSGSRGTYE